MLGIVLNSTRTHDLPLTLTTIVQYSFTVSILHIRKLRLKANK